MPRLRAAQHDPFHHDGERDGRDVDAGVDRQKGGDFLNQAGFRVRQKHVADEDAKPLRRHERKDERQRDRLREPAQKTAQQGRRRERQVAFGDDMHGASVERLAHRAQGARRVDVLQGQRREFVVRAHQREEPRCEQRMAAEVGEKIRVEGNRLWRQHLFRRFEQFGLGVRARFFLLLGGDGRGAQRSFFEQVAVDLARGKPRQFRHRLEALRNHVLRQFLPQDAPDREGVDLALANEKRDELVETIVVAKHDGGLRHAGKLGQFRLDLAKLDAEAADLHLIVDAAAEENVAIRIDRDGVAGTVQHGVRPVGDERIGDEFFGGQGVALQIAPGDAGASDEQLALDAGGEQVERVVDDVAGVVRDGLADRHGLADANLGDGGDDRRLRGAVAVEDRASGAAPARGDGRRAGLAAENDDAKRRHVARQHGEQRRHRVEDADAGGVHEVGQLVGLAHHRRRRDEQRRADEIGHPDFFHGEVEGHRGTLEDHVLLVETIDLVGRAQIMADVASGDDDALRRARRARRVDQVGGMRRRRSEGAGVDRRVIRGIDQVVFRQGVAGHAALDAGVLGRRGEQRLRAGVPEADGDSLERRVGVEGKPGGAGLDDGDLRDEKIGSARHPEAHDMARAHALGQQGARHRGGFLVDLRVGQPDVARNHARCVGLARHGRREDLRQQFVADQLRHDRARQTRSGGRNRAACRHGFARDGMCRRVHFTVSHATENPLCLSRPRRRTPTPGNQSLKIESGARLIEFARPVPMSFGLYERFRVNPQ